MTTKKLIKLILECKPYTWDITGKNTWSLCFQGHKSAEYLRAQEILGGAVTDVKFDKISGCTFVYVVARVKSRKKKEAVA